MPTTMTKDSLRIRGDRGTTQDITHLLTLTPSRSHDLGQPHSRKDPTPRTELLWAIDSDLAASAGLEEHLNHLLDLLEPQTATLHTLRAEGFTMDWFCFVQLENRHSSVRLSTDLLRRLAALPVDLDLDIYG